MTKTPRKQVENRTQTMWANFNEIYIFSSMISSFKFENLAGGPKKFFLSAAFFIEHNLPCSKAALPELPPDFVSTFSIKKP